MQNIGFSKQNFQLSFQPAVKPRADGTLSVAMHLELTTLIPHFTFALSAIAAKTCWGA